MLKQFSSVEEPKLEPLSLAKLSALSDRCRPFAMRRILVSIRIRVRVRVRVVLSENSPVGELKG